MGKKIFAMDVNLGFVEDQKWKDFKAKHDIEVVNYSDLAQMVDDLKKDKTSFSYLPAANYFYLRSNTFYKPIANALFSANHTCTISSLLIVAKDSPIDKLEQLKGQTYGYINTFCTSSYFAPAILLKRNGFTFPSFFSKTMPVGAWQLQIDAVIAGKVAATMIQEDIWHSLPSNAEKTKIIAKVEHLPSPLVISGQGSFPELEEELKKLLLSYKPSVPPGTLFNGLSTYQKDLVGAFYQEAANSLKT